MMKFDQTNLTNILASIISNQYTRIFMKYTFILYVFDVVDVVIFFPHTLQSLNRLTFELIN
jgi:hypothetical protein